MLTDIYLIGDFNDWKESPKYRAKRIPGTGNWELKLSEKAMKHGDLFKMKVHWEGGEVSAFLLGQEEVVQDVRTKIFSAQSLESGTIRYGRRKLSSQKTTPLLIYRMPTSVWDELTEKVGTSIQSLRKMFCRRDHQGWLQLYARLWLFQDIHTMVRSVIM